jgi:hypothetical protein
MVTAAIMTGAGFIGMAVGWHTFAAVCAVFAVIDLVKALKKLHADGAVQEDSAQAAESEPLPAVLRVRK